MKVFYLWRMAIPLAILVGLLGVFMQLHVDGGSVMSD
jgi:hypothetical protein